MRLKETRLGQDHGKRSGSYHMKKLLLVIMSALLFGCTDSHDREVRKLYNQVQLTLEEVGGVLSLNIPNVMNYDAVENELLRAFPLGTKIEETQKRLSELNDIKNVVIKKRGEYEGTSIYLIIKSTSETFSYEICFYFGADDVLEQILARHAITGAVGSY
jgi:hypothetical protein